MATTYDEKCEELADHFLQDDPNLYTMTHTHHLACAIQQCVEDYIETANSEANEPGTGEARRRGCTCSAPFPKATDIDPPEIKIDRWCPLHGRDPDVERERELDRKTI